MSAIAKPDLPDLIVSIPIEESTYSLCPPDSRTPKLCKDGPHANSLRDAIVKAFYSEQSNYRDYTVCVSENAALPVMDKVVVLKNLVDAFDTVTIVAKSAVLIAKGTVIKAKKIVITSPVVVIGDDRESTLRTSIIATEKLTINANICRVEGADIYIPPRTGQLQVNVAREFYFLNSSPNTAEFLRRLPQEKLSYLSPDAAAALLPPAALKPSAAALGPGPAAADAKVQSNAAAAPAKK